MNYSEQQIEDMTRQIVEKHGADAGRQFLEYARQQQAQGDKQGNFADETLDTMKEAGKNVARGLVEGAAATAGQATAARMVKGPVSALAIPAAGALAGGAANVVNQLYSDKPYQLGQTLQTMGVSAIPGVEMAGNLAKSFTESLPQQILGGVAGKTAQTLYDEKRLPTVGELGVAVGSAMFGAKMGQLAGTGRKSAEEAIRMTNNLVRDTNIKEMVGRKLKIDPALANKDSEMAAAMNTAAGGQTSVQRMLVAENQPIINQIAREDIGFPLVGVELNPINLADHIVKLKVAEREIKNIRPQYEKVLERFQDARDDAAKLWADYTNPDIAGARSPLKKEAQLMDKKVDRYAALLEQMLINDGRDDLLQEFTKNRRLISKTMIVKNNLKAGDVDASGIAAVRDKGLRSLDGGLEFIARAYDTMPQVMRMSAETQAASATPLIPAAVAAAVAGGGSMARGLPVNQALGATAAAALSPYIARAAIKSGPVQSFMSQQRYNLNDPGFQANLARFATQGVLRQ
jgi:hypothetical protein